MADLIGTGIEGGSSWSAAEDLAHRLLSVDGSSAEAQILTSAALTLLQATIAHLSLTTASEVERIDQCRQFFQDEIESPGRSLYQLVESPHSEIRAAGSMAIAFEGRWVECLNPRNMVVMTVLMNMRTRRW